MIIFSSLSVTFHDCLGDMNESNTIIIVSIH